MYYVYVIKSENGKCYIGRTNDLKRRFKEHLMGKNHTTHRMKNIKLIFYECFISKEDSIRRERYFKTTKGKKSLKLILRDSLLK
ncbi:MAG: excinuclease ABC subunit C [Candidatus Parcubacteria bacterium]|nr:MAG: excinuclease ABC subunit C [Candidatus Parcubacteria bacterium]